MIFCLTQRRNVKSTALSFPRSGVGMQTEPLERFVTQSVTGGIPTETVTAIKLSRHSGMDRRNPDCRDADNLCHPWSLGSGDPCRNDALFLT